MQQLNKDLTGPQATESLRVDSEQSNNSLNEDKSNKEGMKEEESLREDDSLPPSST